MTVGRPEGIAERRLALLDLGEIGFLAVARLLLSMGRAEAVSRRRSAAMMKLLARFPDKADEKDPWNQVTGFLGEGLPRRAHLWSKAGWSSRTRHDGAIVDLPGGTRFVLVVMSFGPGAAKNRRLLPFIAGQVARRVDKSAEKRRKQRGYSAAVR